MSYLSRAPFTIFSFLCSVLWIIACHFVLSFLMAFEFSVLLFTSYDYLLDIYRLSSFIEGPGGSMSQVVGLPNNSYKPITNTAWVGAWLCILQKGCTRLAAASDKAYQLLAHGRWFSPGTPDSSTTKTGRHEIAEILLKVALKHQKSNIKSIKSSFI